MKLGLSVKSLPPLSISTTPTSGVQTSTSTYDNVPLCFREVGSAISWHHSLERSNVVFFVVDASNLTRMSGPASEIESLFHRMKASLRSSQKLKPIAIVLNKTDVSTSFDLSSISRFLRLKELCTDYANAAGVSKVTDAASVFEVSAYTGHNIDSLLAWLKGTT